MRKKSRRLKQCQKLLKKIKKNIEKDYIEKAEKLYVRCRKQYTKLSEEEQKEIYDKMKILYEELS